MEHKTHASVCLCVFKCMCYFLLCHKHNDIITGYMADGLFFDLHCLRVNINILGPILQFPISRHLNNYRYHRKTMPLLLLFTLPKDLYQTSGSKECPYKCVYGFIYMGLNMTFVVARTINPKISFRFIYIESCLSLSDSLSE